MTRRALTMMELLVSLALLGLLSTALSAWVQTTVRASAKAGTTLPWETSAQQLLNRIAEDLLIGDFVDAQKPKTQIKIKDQRVHLIEGRLVIRTRADSIGACEHLYQLTPAADGAAQLTLTQRVDGEAGAAAPRLLLDDVADWELDLDVKARRLSVTITSSHGRAIARSCRWL